MLKILLVEDNELNRAMLSRRLARYGYDILHANNGVEGVEQARSQQPDIIVMDIDLPVLDGLDATRSLRANRDTAAIPVIGLSAHSFEHSGQTAMNAGMNHYETKPLNMDSLLAAITRLTTGQDHKENLKQE